MKILDLIVEILLIVGGLNWGFIAVANMDVIAEIFGGVPNLTRIIYGLVGVAALYHLFNWTSMKRRKKV